MLTKLAVTVSPRYSKLVPEILVSVPGQSARHELDNTLRLEFEFDEPCGWLEVEFVNKPDHDADTAVVVDQVEFFGISDARFAWAGMYTPRYPEPWYSQQTPTPPALLPGQTYLGWNGTWRLDFELPVFGWMHRIMNLGWQYQ